MALVDPQPRPRPRSWSRAGLRSVPLLLALAVGLVAFLVTIRLGGVGDAARRAAVPTTPPVAGATPRALADIAATTLPMVFTVEVDTERGVRFGTGWPLDATGDIVTNDHVVERALAVRLVERSGVAHAAIVLGTDALRDIAVLRITDHPPGAGLAIGGADIVIGQQVVVLASARATGHGDTTFESVGRLHDSITVDPEPDDPAQGRRQYDDMTVLTGAEVFQGNSGGPVVDAAGRVVGIVTATSASRPEAYAIPIGRVLDELRSFAARTPSPAP